MELVAYEEQQNLVGIAQHLAEVERLDPGVGQPCQVVGEEPQVFAGSCSILQKKSTLLIWPLNRLAILLPGNICP